MERLQVHSSQEMGHRGWRELGGSSQLAAACTLGQLQLCGSGPRVLTCAFYWEKRAPCSGVTRWQRDQWEEEPLSHQALANTYSHSRRGPLSRSVNPVTVPRNRSREMAVSWGAASPPMGDVKGEEERGLRMGCQRAVVSGSALILTS